MYVTLWDLWWLQFFQRLLMNLEPRKWKTPWKCAGGRGKFTAPSSSTYSFSSTCIRRFHPKKYHYVSSFFRGKISTLSAGWNLLKQFKKYSVFPFTVSGLPSYQLTSGRDFLLQQSRQNYISFTLNRLLVENNRYLRKQPIKSAKYWIWEQSTAQ